MTNQTQARTVNRPLLNTYGWLRMNGTEISFPAEYLSLPCGYELSEGVRAIAPDELGGLNLQEIRGGMGPNDFTAGTDIALIGFQADCNDGFNTARVLRLNFQAGKNINNHINHACALGSLGLYAKAGSDFTVIININNINNNIKARNWAALQIKAKLEKDSRLRLAVIQDLGADDIFLNNLGVECGENARFEYTRLILGGRESYDGCRVNLIGNQSAFAADIGYNLRGHEKLDMNYEAIHTGRRAECEIHASGVLRDDARKLFRGTIDLRKGCSGSIGNETEDVLLLDPTVRNSTLPVILCGEEDVVGNHGATIGRPDEDLVYYLESRGMPREKVYQLCARAKLDAVIRKIPDMETIRKLFPDVAEELSPDLTEN